MTLLIARRPVFDGGEKLFAYELAVRQATDSSGIHQDVQPEQLLAEVFLGTGIETVAEAHTVFLTVSSDLLLDGKLRILPADRVILEIPPGVAFDAELTKACTELVSSGYRLAMHADDSSVNMKPLQLAHVIKVDVLSISVDGLPALTDRLRGHPGRLLATNVHSSRAKDRCVACGFDLFEGYRFTAPETPTRKEIAVEHVLVFRVLKLVRDPKATDQQIEELIQGNVGLAYKLLRMVNSAAMGGREVRSIGHALRLLGREQVARWLAVLLVTDGGSKGVRAELTHLALVRARMCELVAELAVDANGSRGPLFLVGIFSVLDQLLEVPMVSLCDTIGVATDVRAALLDRAGVLGQVLRLVEGYVAGDWPSVELMASAQEVDTEALQPLYLDALSWATTQQPR
ncbi:MAG TPA: HDOD domain-containing protein [Gemmatimonadaceae bacterium]